MLFIWESLVAFVTFLNLFLDPHLIQLPIPTFYYCHYFTWSFKVHLDKLRTESKARGIEGKENDEQAKLVISSSDPMHHQFSQ